MHDPELAILVPVLGRPHFVAPLIESARNTECSYRIVFICSPGDDAEMAEIKRQATGNPVTAFTIPTLPGNGDYARKINAAYKATPEPLLFIAADDIRFHKGWDVAARAELSDAVHVVGTNDLGNPRTIDGSHSTHTLVTRTYVDTHGTIDEDGKVLHEGYPHEFVDDEFVATAKYRNAYAGATDSVVEHLHHRWGKRPKDHLGAGGVMRVARGRSHYNARKHLWGEG